MPTVTYKNWLVEHDNMQIAWLRLDVQNSSTNILSKDVLAELQKILNELVCNTPKGVAIISNKAKGFIAGADIKEFTAINSKQEAFEKIQFGQQVFNLLETLSCPSIAIINGFCMGGGLELALTCDYRIALDDSNTRFSLPEIKLGIHPGYGGTVRILRYVNPLIAMDLMLTGRSIDSHQAKKIGLIDYAVPKRHLENAARQIILNKPNKHKVSSIVNLLNSKLIRPIIATQMRKQVSKKAKAAHYPAPYALIDHWVNHYGNEDTMLQHEAQSVAELSTTETAKNLVRVFLLQNVLKGLADSTQDSIQHVHVIGAGVMGGDIATWCVSQGLTITLQDLDTQNLAQAKARAHKYFKRRLKNKVLVKAALDRFVVDLAGNGVPKADVVIEAIFENKAVKRELYASIEPNLRNDAIIATNTSSIEIEELCGAFSDPSRLVGLHFFNPVANMPLIEIVKGKQTNPKTIQQAINFAKQIGKLPLPVKSSPGFLVNRILTPYMVEAGLLKESGTPVTDIDRAAKNFGMPMGPLELADTVGLDVGLHVAELLGSIYGYNIPASFKIMVNAGLLGKKSGNGFYKWKNGKKHLPNSKSSPSNDGNIQDRLVLRFINEAVACYREGIVDDKDLLDAGLVFGTGFAPFRGGPLQFLESTGAALQLEKLNTLHKQFGDRFKPDSGWDKFTS